MKFMKEIRKIYVVGNQKYYASFIDNVELTDNIHEANIVLFTGGEDVDPSLYGCQKHPSTYSNIERDMYEKGIFEQVADNQLVISVCRGSQFCCVMNGGLLVQDCNNHAMYGTHPIYEFGTDRIYEITSTHHQMQYPYNLADSAYTILMGIVNRRCDYYMGDKIDCAMICVEPEVVHYHRKDKPQCLAIQGHPEMMRKEAPIVIRLNEIINELVEKICE